MNDQVEICTYGEGLADGSGCIKAAGHDGDHVPTPGAATPLPPKPVAYISQRTHHLYCVICARQETGTQPLTANEVRPDAECNFCGGGVFAIASRTLAGVIVRYMTDPPFIPPAHYRRDDGVECCVHTIPVGPDSCRECRELEG